MMLSTSQSFGSTTSAVTGFGNLGFLADAPPVVETDPNSPELFKQNLGLIREHVSHLQQLVRNVLGGIQNAYHAGSSPQQVEVDIAAMNQAIQALVDLFSSSGVGALPLLQPPFGDGSRLPLPKEAQLIAQTEQAIHLYYEQLKRSRESAAVVANLLGAPENNPRAAR